MLLFTLYHLTKTQEQGGTKMQIAVKRCLLPLGSMMAVFCVLTVLPILAAATVKSSTQLILSKQCPPGFEKVERVGCKLRSLYQFYDSLDDKGVGGLQTSLPKVRDGFSPEQIDLGRYLFFDPILSGDGSVACAHCHHPDKGFSDGLDRSVGITGKKVSRSAPTIWNAAFLNSFFWDARARTLEEQIEGPLYNEQEMGNTRAHLLSSLNDIPDYVDLFRQAFPDSNSDTVTLDQIYTAITAFEASLISLNSRYDHYAHGDHNALSSAEIKGLNVFRSFVARCAECHTPPLFSNQQIAVLGTPEPEGLPLDIGAEKTFDAPQLKGGFKVPSLRNIAKTAPYMHSGRFETLRDTVEFYTRGRGHAVPEGVDMQLHWHIWEPNLSGAELDRLVDFLKALTDEVFTPEIPKRVPSGLTPIKHNNMKDLSSGEPL